MTDFVQGIAAIFDRYKDLIENIDHSVFQQSFNNSSSIGAHVRHVLDRSDCVVEGFSSGKIDYDKRRRNVDLENNPALCAKEFDRILAEIEGFSGGVGSVVEVSETLNCEGLKASMKSTYERELLDIILHCTHHMATMKFILEKSGIEVDKDFGKNASTVIYEKG